MKFGKFNSSISGPIPEYVCPDTGKVIKSNSFNNLLYQIRDHRIEHGGDLSVGWQDKIGDYLCEQNSLPQCTKFRSKPRKLGVGDVATFFHSMAKWSRKGFKVVDQEVAEERASICATCPKNVHIEGCTGCFRLASKVKRLVGNSKTKYDSLLEGCEVCACSLQAKVWLPKDAMAGTRDKSKFPDHCWIPDEG